MSGAQQVLAAGPSVSVKGRWQPPGHGRMHGPDVALAIAFVAPYAALFFAFAVYPIGYALWMGSKPSLYADLIADPLYLSSVLNTMLFVGVGVNVTMFLALLLSGFFMRPAGGSRPCWSSMSCPGCSRRFKPASRSAGCWPARKRWSIAHCRC